MKLMERSQYKEIKRYNREELQTFIFSIYKTGFQDGVKVGNNTDFKIKLVQLLENTKGVGKATTNKILNTLKEMDK